MVDRAVVLLAVDFAGEGKQTQFDVLKPWLLGEVPDLPQADAARQLGLSEGALKVAMHRLRKRFRELVKAEIAQTVDDTAQVAAELRYLVEELAQPEAPSYQRGRLHCYCPTGAGADNPGHAAILGVGTSQDPVATGRHVSPRRRR